MSLFLVRRTVRVLCCLVCEFRLYFGLYIVDMSRFDESVDWILLSFGACSWSFSCLYVACVFSWPDLGKVIAIYVCAWLSVENSVEYSLSNRVLARFAASIKRNSSLLLPSLGHFQSFQLCRRVVVLLCGKMRSDVRVPLVSYCWTYFLLFVDFRCTIVL